MQEGIVKWFDPKKSYGFISQENGEDVFVHSSSIEGKKYKSLFEGDRVSFSIVSDKKGIAAVGVTVTERNESNKKDRKGSKERKGFKKIKHEWKNTKRRNNGDSNLVSTAQEAEGEVS